jgi:hypothetical protein
MRLTMGRGTEGRQWLDILTGCLLVLLVAVPAGRAGDWESLRESYDKKLKAHAKQIAEIETREPTGSDDPNQRAEKITRDRITAVRAALRGGGKARTLADTADQASVEPSASIDLSREQSEYFDIVTREWGPDGAERRRLRESPATLQKNFERANANVVRATERAEAMAGRGQAAVVERVARLEAEVKEAGDRLRARWQREQALRDRERDQREREAAERARTIR